MFFFVNIFTIYSNNQVHNDRVKVRKWVDGSVQYNTLIIIICNFLIIGSTYLTKLIIFS